MSDYKKALGIIDGDVMDAQESKVTTLVMADTDVVDLGIRPTGIARISFLDGDELNSAVIATCMDEGNFTITSIVSSVNIKVIKDNPATINVYVSDVSSLAVQNLFGDITVEIEFL
jgi:hypothetical protein